MNKKENLDGFEGFAETTADNFDWNFDETVSTAPITAAQVVAEATAEESITTEETEEKDDKTVLDVFKEWEEGSEAVLENEDADDNTVQNTDDNSEPKKESPAIATFNFLKEKGFIDYEPQEGEEITDELALEKAEEGWEAAIEAEVEDTIKSLPEDIKALVKIASKGGNHGELLKAMVAHQVAGITKDTDMSVEENQVLAMRLELKDQEYDDDYIETHIQNLKDSGKLEAMSKKIADKRIKKHEDTIAAQAQAVEQEKTARKEAYKERRTKTIETVSAVENLNGIIINKEDKKALPDYMTVPCVELKDGRVITKMQERLFQAMADPKESVLLGKLLFSGFDFSSVSSATITAYSKAVQDNLENNKNNPQQNLASSGSSHKPKRDLAEMLD